MNADRLLSHFEKIGDAPDAVDRLRRFILDLAVRGKLVEQDERDSTPPESLQLNDDAEPYRTERPATHRYLTTEDERYPVPASWLWTRLGMIGDWGSGSTPSRGKAEYFGGKTSWFKSGELNDNPCLTGSEERVTQLALKECSFRHNKPGDVLFAMYGATIGKLAILAEEAVTNQAVVACSPCAHVLNRYLFLFLLSQRQRFHMASEGGAQPNISKAKVVRCPIPLPPLAEQHRIVEKVDELMMLSDRLEASQKERERRRDRLVMASLNRLSQPTDPDEFKKDAHFHLSNLTRLSTKLEHIKELRKAILNLAVRGKLVPQDEREGTAANSLRTLGMQPADPPPDFEDRVLPSSWCMIRFDDVATISGGVTLGRKLGGRKTASVPYLRVANVQRGGFDLSVIKEVDVPVEEVEKYSLKETDLLMTEGGDWDKVGRSAIWRNQIPLCLHQNHVFRVRMNSSEISPVWFERYFNSPAGRAYFESCSKQTTNLASINMRQVRGCPVPLPPLAEQKRIVTKVDELMLICDQLENQLETQQKGRRQLLEALLHEALVEVG